jgi:predicted Na+-dependent transporter
MSLVKSLTATFVLLAAMILGLGGGLIAPARFDTNLVLWPAIFAQTLAAVGGLRPDWLTEPAKRSEAVRLLLVHHAAATVPYLIAWFFLPDSMKSTPLAIGLIWLAIVPTAAGLPAYATAARTAPSTITAFALLAYLCGLVITPVLALVIFGGGTDIGRLITSMLVGLIIPATLGIIFGRLIRRVPAQIRTAIVAVSMTITTYVFGSAINEALTGGVVSAGVVLVALLAGASRVPLSVALGLLFIGRRRDLRPAAALAAGYKNDALAASTALQVAGPLAVVPALGSLLCEMGLMLAAAIVTGHRLAPRDEAPPETA